MSYKTYTSHAPAGSQFEDKELKKVVFKNLDTKVTIIKKKALDKEDVYIVGYLNRNGKLYEKDEQDTDLVLIYGEKFELLKKKCGSLMGYLPVDGDNHYIAVCRHNFFS